MYRTNDATKIRVPSCPMICANALPPSGLFQRKVTFLQSLHPPRNSFHLSVPGLQPVNSKYLILGLPACSSNALTNILTGCARTQIAGSASTRQALGKLLQQNPVQWSCECRAKVTVAEGRQTCSCSGANPGWKMSLYRKGGSSQVAHRGLARTALGSDRAVHAVCVWESCVAAPKTARTAACSLSDAPRRAEQPWLVYWDAKSCRAVRGSSLCIYQHQ